MGDMGTINWKEWRERAILLTVVAVVWVFCRFAEMGLVETTVICVSIPILFGRRIPELTRAMR
jgi:hypothetical protein